MSRRISTKAAESGQTTGGPADDAIAPPVSSATAAEEHHTVVEPEIIEPEILPKQASGKTAAHKAAKPMDVTDAEDDNPRLSYRCTAYRFAASRHLRRGFCRRSSSCLPASRG